MKYLKLFFYAISLTVMCASCGSDDGDEGGVSGVKNVNSNAAYSSQYPYSTRLEFPRLKGDGNIVITHSTADSYGVNYSYEWDINKKSQRWSCYQMHTGYQGSAGRYSGNPQYPEDPDLPSKYYLDKDYFYGSGFNHGHICPSADRQYSKTANYQTFFLTNMQPQYYEMNAGIWEKMEEKVRVWTRSSGTDTLYVCKGGTIDSEAYILKRISNKLIVPKYFYMALLLKNRQGYRALAFWVENEKVDRKKDNLADYVISIDELERRTGIDFFCNLPDDIENQVERDVALNVWGLSK